MSIGSKLSQRSVESKRHGIVPVALFAFILLVHVSVEAKVKSFFVGSFDGRLAERLDAPMTPASERFDLRFEQDFVFSPQWKAALGFSGWSDAVYDKEPQNYSASVAHDDSSDLRFRELYLQYQSSHFLLKLGNQQVVWGEAFGNSYADIVNPKDFRDGASGDLSDVRLQVPMLNSKLIFSNFSLQALYIPEPFFNILPSPGNDYAYPFSRVLGGADVSIQRQESLPLNATDGEYGGRISALLGHWDLSVLGFNGFDRNPSYALSPNTVLPQKIVLQEQHTRVKSYGATLTKDFGGFVLRAEGVITENRYFPTLVNANLVNVPLRNMVYVVGFDFPSWSGFNLGAQWSQDLLGSQPPMGLLRTANQSMLALRLARTFFRDQEFEVLTARSVVDQGQRTQLKYNIPTSERSEVHFGVEIFSGPFSSDFGKLGQANRAFVLFRYSLRS